MRSWVRALCSWVGARRSRAGGRRSRVAGRRSWIRTWIRTQRSWIRTERSWLGASSQPSANRVAAGREALERGTATAEYAIATLAACAFAGMLLAILRSGEVRGLLFGLVRRALSVG
jgi:Protein of unknown function (DUF4244)